MSVQVQEADAKMKFKSMRSLWHRKGEGSRRRWGESSHCKEREKEGGLRRKSIRRECNWDKVSARPIAQRRLPHAGRTGPALNPYHAESLAPSSLSRVGFLGPLQWVPTEGCWPWLYKYWQMVLNFCIWLKIIRLVHYTIIPFNYIICPECRLSKTSGKPVINALYIACP